MTVCPALGAADGPCGQIGDRVPVLRHRQPPERGDGRLGVGVAGEREVEAGRRWRRPRPGHRCCRCRPGRVRARCPPPPTRMNRRSRYRYQCRRRCRWRPAVHARPAGAACDGERQQEISRRGAHPAEYDPRRPTKRSTKPLEEGCLARSISRTVDRPAPSVAHTPRMFAVQGARARLSRPRGRVHRRRRREFGTGEPPPAPVGGRPRPARPLAPDDAGAAGAAGAGRRRWRQPTGHRRRGGTVATGGGGTAGGDPAGAAGVTGAAEGSAGSAGTRRRPGVAGAGGWRRAGAGGRGGGAPARPARPAPGHRRRGHDRRRGRQRRSGGLGAGADRRRLRRHPDRVARRRQDLGRPRLRDHQRRRRRRAAARRRLRQGHLGRHRLEAVDVDRRHDTGPTTAG